MSRLTDDPGVASFLVLAGALIVGLWIGDTLFSRSYGLAPQILSRPWWYAAVGGLGLLVAGWRAAHHWARVLACVLCIAAIPVRYQLLQSWNGGRSVVDRSPYGSPKGNL